MKKLFKKPIAVILVLAMVFGSISAFATTFNDGHKRTVCYTVKYFIDADNDGTPDTETTKLEEGELFWARLYIKTDYPVSGHQFSLLYNKNFATAMQDSTTAFANNTYLSISSLNASFDSAIRGGSIYVFTNASAGRYKVLVNDGILPSDTPDTYGLIELMGTEGLSNCFSYDTFTYQFMFKVNSGADRTDDSFRAFIPSGVIRNWDNWESTDYSTYFTRVDLAEEEGITYGKATSSSDPADWEEYYPSVELETDENTVALAHSEGDTGTAFDALENVTFDSDTFADNYASIGTTLTYNIYNADGTLNKTETTRYAVGATVNADTLIENTVPHTDSTTGETSYGYDDANDFYKDLGYAEPTGADYTDLYEIDATKTDPAFTTTAGTAATYNMYIKAATFDITYDAGTGKWTDDAVAADKTAELAYGTTLPATPDAKVENEGYELTGWTYTTADGSDYTDATMPAQDLTATAQWSAKEYTLTYKDADGKDYETYTNATVEMNIADDLTPDDPEKEGYTFTGWTYKDEDGNTYTGTMMPAYNLIATPNFTANPYTITYEAGEGSWKTTAAEKATVACDDPIPTAPDGSLLEKTGYTFNGWKYTDAKGNEYTGATMPAYDLTATAQWKVNQYTITFANTGDTTIAPITLDYDAKVTAPADPTRTGYTFTGWDAAIPENMPDANMTITGTWSINTPEVHFMSDGAELDSVKTTYNEKLSENTIEDPEETGYTFTGWTYYTDKDTQTEATEYKGTTMPDQELWAVAQWSINQYKVTFEATTPDGTKKVYSEDKYDFGTDLTTITAPAADVIPGYTFAWDTSVLTGKLAAADMTVAGTYTAIDYTVIYTGNGATAKTATPVNIGDALSDPTTAAGDGWYKAGYAISWGNHTVLDAALIATANEKNEITIEASYTPGVVNYTVNTYEMNADGTWGAAVPTVKTAVADTTVTETAAPATGFELDTTKSDALTAKVEGDGTTVINIYYARSQYALTYDLDGGEFTNAAAKTSDTLYYGATITETSATKTGYKFLGWDINGDNVADTVPTTMPANALNIKALFEVESYVISFDSDGGSAVENKTVVYDTSVALDVPTKEGYTFTGWYTDTTKTTAFATPAADGTVTYKVADLGESGTKVPVYAGWTINQYALTINADGGTTTSSSAKLDYGTAISLDTAPTKEGYTFAGWVCTKTEDGSSVSTPATMPAYDVTATAKWTVNSYTVTYDANGGKFADGKTSETKDFNYDTAIAAYDTEPTLDGYIFKGWDADGDGVADTDLGKMTTTPVTLTAVWEADTNTTYTVEIYEMDTDGNYQAVEGYPKTMTGTTDTTADATALATVAEGEYLDTTNTAYKASDTIKGDGSTVLKIYIARKTATVSIDTNADGVTDTDVPTYYGKALNVVIAENAPAGVPEKTDEATPDTYPDDPAAIDPETTEGYNADNSNKKTYEPAGWTDQNGDAVADGATVTGDTQVYPAYILCDEYKIATGYDYTTKQFTYATDEQVDADANYHFDAKYVYDTAKGEYVAEEVTYNVPEDAVTGDMATYFDFVGWSKYTCDLNCTDAAETADPDDDALATVTKTVDNSVYFAHYKLKTFTVTYNPDNGEETTSYTATVLGAIPVPGTDPVKEGYLFGGWQDENGKLYTSYTEMPTNDINFTAVWTPESTEVTISYEVPDFWGRTHTYSYPANSGDPMPEYDTPYVLGKKFAGWSPELPETVPDADTTYTAQYETDPAFVAVVVGGTVIAGATVAAVCATNAALITGAAVIGGAAIITGAVVLANHTYKVTYMVDGDVYKTYYVVEGTKVLTPADPEVDGKTFAGWSPEVPDKMPGNDLTFEATWASSIDDEIPDTGSATASFAALAVISAAAGAAYVLSTRKKKEDD